MVRPAPLQVVKILNVVEEPELVKASTKFEAEIASGDTIGFCQSMASKAKQKGKASEAEVWGFMQVIFGKYCTPLYIPNIQEHFSLLLFCAGIGRGECPTGASGTSWLSC